MINKLYSLLLDSYSYNKNDRFSKFTTPVFHTDRSRKIQEILMRAAVATNVNKLPLFASVVCYMNRFSLFGDEIEKLDPVNTYVQIERTQNDTDDSMCMYELTDMAYISTELKRYLDKDIIDNLEAVTWLDYMAAGCLQMLREVSE